jgi:hypothetical protein
VDVAKPYAEDSYLEIEQATVRASDSFPYLAPPNPDPAFAGKVPAPSKVADQLAFLEAAGLASR